MPDLTPDIEVLTIVIYSFKSKIHWGPGKITAGH